MEYIYFGDDLTDPCFVKQKCIALRGKDGNCIRGNNWTMLVQFEMGAIVVVDVRLLRKIKP